MKRTKRRILILCLACFMLLTAGIFRTIEIWSDEPLIDLEALLTAQEVGQAGSTDSGSSVKPTDQKGDSDGSTPHEKPVERPQVVINVRDKVISVEGKVFTYDREKGYAEGFEAAAAELATKEILLQDYYAESHTYRYVLEKLESTVKKKSQLKQGVIGGVQGAQAYE